MLQALSITISASAGEGLGQKRQQKGEERRGLGNGEGDRGRERFHTWVMDLLWDDFFVQGGGLWLRHQQPQSFPSYWGGAVPGQDGKRFDLKSLCTSARVGRTP